MEEYFKKIGFVITLVLAVVGAISAVVTIYAPVNNIVRTVSLFVTYVCFAALAVMLVMYLIKWLEIGIKNGETFQIVAKLEQDIRGVEDIAGQINELKNDITALKEENNRNLEIDSQKKFCPIKTSSYIESSEDVNNELHKLLKNKVNEIKELHIICFGRNGFGGAVKYIIERSFDIKVKIIVFNPQSHPDICLATDDVMIRRNIETWLRGSKEIEVIMSEIPPMIRAAVAYIGDKDGNLKAIWGSIQSYRFAFDPDTKAISLEKPVNSLISICEESKTVVGDFCALVNSFEEEFKRLEEHSQTARIIPKAHGKSEIVFEERSHG